MRSRVLEAAQQGEELDDAVTVDADVRDERNEEDVALLQRLLESRKKDQQKPPMMSVSDRTDPMRVA